MIDGITWSPDFPITGNAFATSCNATTVLGCGFVAVVAPDNSSSIQPQYSSYIDALPTAIAVDPVGHIYLGGFTFGVSPITANSYPCPVNGACGSYIAVLDWSAPPASQLLYGANVGGDYSLEADSESGGGFVGGIAADAGGNIYLTGATTIPNLPVTPDAYQSQCLGCIEFQQSGGMAWPDGFLSEFNPSASGAAQLVYSTYLGGSGRPYFETGDEALGIAVDAAGHVALTGYASSNNFPVSSNAVEPRCLACGNGGTQGGSAAFITEFAFSTPQFTLTPTPEMSPTPLRTPTLSPTPTATSTQTPTPSPTPIPASSSRLKLYPRNLDFPDEHFLGAGGETSAPKYVKLKVAGNEPVQIQSSAASGDFLAGADCDGVLLQPGAVCSVPVFFTPSALGKRSGRLLITSNAVDPAKIVQLTGHGIKAKLSYKPHRLHFEPTAVGQTSSPKTITLTNDDGVKISIGASVLSSNFQIAANSCGEKLASGSCAIQVAFAPIAKGKAESALNISSDAFGAPLRISLSGNGE